MIILGWVLIGLSILLVLHAVYSLYLTLYAWNDPDRLQPDIETFLPPKVSFSVLIPARHEEKVIGETVRGICRANYPPHLMEIFVICSSDDHLTIEATRETTSRWGLRHVNIVTFDEGPIGKSHALNVGLRHARGDYVAVFDAEDDVHPDIFNAVNTMALKTNWHVIQGPVQLMNYDSTWYATFNVLEYFAWFNSRLRYYATKTSLFLGGNTVFVKRMTLQNAGGWDESCLTEDADLGVRLAALGVPMGVLYHPALATREETPHSIPAFVRQRTRWHQGFLQVLHKGDWLRLRRFDRLWLTYFTLIFPIFHGFTTLLWPLAPFLILTVRLPVSLAIITYLPLYTLVLLYVVNVCLLWEFTRTYKLRFHLSSPLVMALTFLPYQWLLGISAIRAVLRESLGRNDWEKTEHPAVHRKLAKVQAVAEAAGEGK